MSPESRIEQFKQMAEADPDNELGHFSLGKEYLKEGLPAEAVTPLTKAIELNPRLSKAYQMLGEAYVGANQKDAAISALTRGATVANEQGDRMPRDAMLEQLRTLGAPLPDVEDAVPAAAAGASEGPSAEGFRCARCGNPSGQLEKRPFKGALGEKVFANVCAACWREWIPMGTKVINELGLVMSSPEHQETYDQYMVEFLQLEDR